MAYEKQDFKPGMILEAEHLCKIEDQLCANIEEIAKQRMELNEKQNGLVDGVNIKTINNKSILGRGNLDLAVTNRIVYEGSGGNLDLVVEDTCIYYISGYETITIAVLSTYYIAHLFVTFPSTEEAVGFILPEGMVTFGDDPTTAESAQFWEVSLDSNGGALFVNKAV